MPRQPAPLSERRQDYRRREDRLAAARQKTLVASGRVTRSDTAYLLADVAPPNLAQSEPIQSEVEGESFSILVVEDNADLRQFIARALAKEYRVHAAADGVEGLEMARRVQPDLVLADVMMPHMDGHALCRALKGDAMLATVPVILLTARVGSDAAVEGLDAGADDYLAKPFDLRELQARIRAHLRAHALQRTLDERESRLLAIGGMTAAIAHDLKNPLTAISMLIEVASRRATSGGNSTEILSDLRMLARESERLRRMITELLDFARAGALELSRKPTAIREFLRAVMEQPERVLRASGINLVMDFDGVAGAEAPIDAERLHRVIENLVANAREAVSTPRRRENPCVWMRATVDDDQLLIRIADNGPGISEEMRVKLFQPFASANKAHGVGLGLVMARSLVRAHDGDVEVEPRAPEGGAAFLLRLPCTNSRVDIH